MLALDVEPDGLGSWIEMRINNITPMYVRELRGLGIKDLDADELVDLSSSSVSAKYISELRAAGLKDVDADELVECMDHNVTPDFIRAMHEAGIEIPYPHQVTIAKVHPNEVRRVKGERRAFHSSHLFWGGDAHQSERVPQHDLAGTH